MEKMKDEKIKMRKFLWALLAGIYSLSLYSAGNPSDEINAGGPNSAFRPVSFVSPILPPLEPTSNLQHMSASGGQLSTAEDVAAVWLINQQPQTPYYPGPYPITTYPQQAHIFPYLTTSSLSMNSLPPYPMPYGPAMTGGPVAMTYGPLPTVTPRFYPDTMASGPSHTHTLPSSNQIPTVDAATLAWITAHRLNARPYMPQKPEEPKEQKNALPVSTQSHRYEPYAEPRGKKTKENKPPCRCGSTTHQRTNHHGCPENPDKRWTLKARHKQPSTH
jgi:hypothetical protein